MRRSQAPSVRKQLAATAAAAASASQSSSSSSSSSSGAHAVPLNDVIMNDAVPTNLDTPSTNIIAPLRRKADYIDDNSNTSTTTPNPSLPATKKPATKPPSGTFIPPKRTPLLSKLPSGTGVGTALKGKVNVGVNGKSVNADGDGVSNVEARAFKVMYRKKQSSMKKHKNWEDDGFLVARGSVVTLMDSEGKNGREVEITDALSWASFSSGNCFLGRPTEDDQQSTSANSQYLAPVSTPFTPVVSTKPMTRPGGSGALRLLGVNAPRHNPDAVNAVVFPRPAVTAARKQIVDVVLDPVLSAHIRPHQIEGVKFLYECVMGMKNPAQHGAILADEMGLGKTLQAISLIWTMLKQGPYQREGPLAKRALILCPATLCENWKKEFKKWLGDERIRVYIMDDILGLQNFTEGRVYQVLVCGYMNADEKFRSAQDSIKRAEFDIVIADEGHRLKNSGCRISQAFSSLPTRRRVILSGTPIQADEFFAICDLVNPGVLGTRATFSNVYEEPIGRSRESTATLEDIQIGKLRSQELARLTRQFILRRTAISISRPDLPPKTEVVVFIRLSESQESIYEHVVRHPLVRKLCVEQSTQARHILGYLTILKKLASSAGLVTNEDTFSAKELDLLKFKKSETGNTEDMFAVSSKMSVLRRMLAEIKETTNEKVVIVSNWTQTLDLVEKVLTTMQMTFLRLDGQTDSSKRQGLVDRFNTTDQSTNFAFLLSAKAGGVGISLIGASRLFLLDIDWNPSICLQAMARIWRDGQKRNVFIYRMLTAGTIEERIFQRQMNKCGLSDELIDDKGDGCVFAANELRDLLIFNKSTSSLTISSLMGSNAKEGGADADSKSSGGWSHVNGFDSKDKTCEIENESDEVLIPDKVIRTSLLGSEE
ncbi:helicase, partial [Blyttiomyces sp. JEL0837]